ncbi:hypothetical protein [Mycobacteroides abscessus]|uniref:hypothetical protein n=1 Tax=Mycobacteroides abscessus TaxID=36809 RepID=UPI00092A248C|nr:hypothetical protein [Mycobacteroides abscessus]SKV92643.1 Uncharacterised protein [Mycobacteroides abscessus subsp. massiliense]MBN7544907.1 hypothetical protein [Mycobacteroides abscessus subsp. abscessus]QSM96390.1 hypothetical protein I3U31_12140 [Mycobacteroides abscessus subsp. abscessus]QSN01422.1 hypothetical protein I3U40_12150 [Mycobacteroides abscessus subsp. abscessus]SHU73276.1 Uncharacterised protein [Mycobacteroides abscessus subsp. abscessus]
MNTLEPVDGSVYAYQVSPHEGLAYVTVAGPDEDQPMILGFDLADLDQLNAARKELRAGIKKLKAEPDPGEVLRILAASRSESFIYDRVEYHYDPLAGEWVAWGRVDKEEN